MANPEIYVGTYGKYNQGSIKGAWLDLTDYSDKEDFLRAASELHKDESDPELMFQDVSNIPDWAWSESDIHEDFWEYLSEIDETDQDAFDHFVNYYYGDRMTDLQEAIENFQEAYQGEFRTMTDFAYQLIDDIGFEGLGSSIEFYFDTDSFVRDLGYEGWEVATEKDAENYPDDYPDGPGVYAQGEYYGDYDSLEELVESWLDEKIISEEQFETYFDYEKFGRELGMTDYYKIGDYVFRHI